MKALLITHCSDSHMWYADHLGKIVPLINTYADEYLSREPAGYTNIVRKQDATIVDVSQELILYLPEYLR